MKRKISAMILAATVIFTVMPVETVVAATSDEQAAEMQVVEEMTDFSGQTGYKQPTIIELTDEEEAEMLAEQEIEAEESDVSSAYYGASTDWAAYGSDYCYNQMNSNQKALYNGFESACLNYINSTQDAHTYNSQTGYVEMVSYSGLTTAQAQEVALMFTYCNPQYYFCNSYFFTGSSSIAIGMYPAFVSGSDRANYTSQMKSAIDYYVAIGSAQSTAAAKEKAVHDALIDDIDYVANDYDQSAYSALLLGQTVCAGYTKSFAIIMNALGIETTGVTSLEHAWNEIYLNGKWYNVDLTWDDQTWVIIYDYFNVTDTAITGSALDENGYHVTESCWSGIRPTSSTTYTGAPSTYRLSTPGYSANLTDSALVISLTQPLGTIYYTTDGSTPTTSSSVCSGSISLPRGVSNQNYTVKAIAGNSPYGYSTSNVLTLSVTVPKAAPTSARVAGSTRYDTAIQCAEVLRNGGTFNAVVIACADNFPDALAGGTLASQIGAPILLVGNSAEGTQATLNYINSYVNKNATVYLLGGESAVPASVVSVLNSYGYSNIGRLGGATRYETNMQIVNATSIPTGRDVVIVSGTGYADSLSISGIAGANGMPIFLAGDSLTAEEIAKISQIAPAHIYIIGGTAAVNTTVEAQARSLCANVARISGATRYETSIAVANYFGMGSSTSAVIAYGGNFPDGLTGGVLAASLHAPVILVSDDQYLVQRNFIQSSSISKLLVMGGNAAISDNTVNQLMN